MKRVAMTQQPEPASHGVSVRRWLSCAALVGLSSACPRTPEAASAATHSNSALMSNCYRGDEQLPKICAREALLPLTQHLDFKSIDEKSELKPEIHQRDFDTRVRGGRPRSPLHMLQPSSHWLEGHEEGFIDCELVAREKFEPRL